MRFEQMRAALSLSAALLLVASISSADEGEPEQLVWLKNGGFVRGALIELVPDDHVTVKLPTGELRRIAFSDVERTSSSMSKPTPEPPASAPSTAPSVPPSAAPSAPPAPAPSKPAKADAAVIKLFSKSRVVELQGRPRLDTSAPWRPLCTSPCDDRIQVKELEFRVAGEGITPSRTFVIEPSESTTVRLNVLPGDDTVRRLGRWALLIGAPTAALGATGLGVGLGTNVEHRDGIALAGAITAIVGGVLSLAALPMLQLGDTTVKNQKGNVVGALTGPSQAF